MTSFEDLDRAQQQRVALRSALRIVTSTVVLVVLYALLPAASNSSARTLIQLLIGLVVFMALLGWQVLRILDAEQAERVVVGDKQDAFAVGHVSSGR